MSIGMGETMVATFAFLDRTVHGGSCHLVRAFSVKTRWLTSTWRFVSMATCSCCRCEQETSAFSWRRRRRMVLQVGATWTEGGRLSMGSGRGREPDSGMVATTVHYHACDVSPQACTKTMDPIADNVMKAISMLTAKCYRLALMSSTVLPRARWHHSRLTVVLACAAYSPLASNPG